MCCSIIFYMRIHVRVTAIHKSLIFKNPFSSPTHQTKTKRLPSGSEVFDSLQEITWISKEKLFAGGGERSSENLRRRMGPRPGTGFGDKAQNRQPR